jgi:FAD/FMN-containing dehydrogenase
MKKNKYGNTEDFVLSIKFVTTLGTYDIKNDAERKSVGPDLRHIILGSEGRTFLIILRNTRSCNRMCSKSNKSTRNISIWLSNIQRL